MAGKVLVVGVTGTGGTGKTTVSRMLAERGAAVVDADRLARTLLEPGQPEYYRVVEEFGRAGVVAADGSIDRARLRDLVFSDAEALERLNAVMHPPLKRLVAAEVDRLRGAGGPLLVGAGVPMIVVDAAVLVEAGMAEMVDAVVLVTAPEDVCAARLAARTRMTVREAGQLLASQERLSRRRAEAADYVIQNDGGLEELERKVDGLLAWCKELGRREGAPDQ